MSAPRPRFQFLRGPSSCSPLGGSVPPVHPISLSPHRDRPQLRPPASLVRQGLRNLWVWALVEFAIVPLPLLLLGLWPVNGRIDPFLVTLMLYLAALGFVLGFGVVVLPCAIVSAWRLKRNPPSAMHLVPYLATGVCAVAFMPTTGILFGVVMIPQAVVAPVLHGLMARHYQRSTQSEGLAAS